MLCLGLETGAAGWKGQMNPLSYGGTPYKRPTFKRSFGLFPVQRRPSFAAFTGALLVAKPNEVPSLS